MFTESTLQDLKKYVLLCLVPRPLPAFDTCSKPPFHITSDERE